MNILFIATECAPFVQTGGLGDVMNTLPRALVKLGVQAGVIIPKYRDIPEMYKDRMEHVADFFVNLGWRSQYCGIEKYSADGVDYYFIDNEYYFARSNIYGNGEEEGERFGFFSRAVLEALPRIGLKPDVVHCNDWHTGIIPALLKLQYADNEFYKDIKSVYTIHNLRYQGIFPWMYIDELLGLGEEHFTAQELEYYGCISYMKAGLVFADRISTVSPTYAQEMQTPYYGERLDGLISARSGDLVGILNGINLSENDPATDPAIAANFSVEDLAGKAVCKAATQEEMCLDKRNVPIIAIISRLNEQKGLDLVERVLDDIMRMDVQLIVLGRGEEHYQEMLSWAAWRYQGRMAARIEFNSSVARRVYAGADILLMPSQFEPCGIAQMIAMRYGALPIVRETGGLKDTVQPYNQYDDIGTGFSFANYNAHEMLFTIERAVSYYENRSLWEGIMKRAMQVDFSWDTSAKQYLKLYSDVSGARIPKKKKSPAAK